MKTAFEEITPQPHRFWDPSMNRRITSKELRDNTTVGWFILTHSISYLEKEKSKDVKYRTRTEGFAKW